MMQVISIDLWFNILKALNFFSLFFYFSFSFLPHPLLNSSFTFFSFFSSLSMFASYHVAFKFGHILFRIYFPLRPAFSYMFKSLSARFIPRISSFRITSYGNASNEYYSDELLLHTKNVENWNYGNVLIIFVS